VRPDAGRCQACRCSGAAVARRARGGFVRVYLDTPDWVFIAVVLAGIAVTVYARLDD
jgi:hypothetical protein